MKRKLAATAVVLAGYLCAGTARAQDKEVERARITTETVTTPSSSLTTQTVDVDYEIDRRRDQGWNTPWGLMFSLNNVLNLNSPILSPFDGLGAAGFMTLTPQMMLRGGFTLTRTHSPSTITETQLTAGDSTVSTYTKSAPNPTSQFGVTVHGDALWRLSRNKVAPYVGGGALLSYQYNRQTVDDDVTSLLAVTKYRSRFTDVSFGVRGIVGAEWRVHSNFALFAEYNLSLNMLHYTQSDTRVTVQDTKDNPTAVTSTHTDSKVTSWFNVNTTLQQTATVGLMVLF